MATVYKTPGVYVEEISTLPPSVAQVSTAIPAFIGCTELGPAPDATGVVTPKVVRIDTLLDFEEEFGGPEADSFTITTQTVQNVQTLSAVRDQATFDFLLYYTLKLYFQNGGGSCYIVSVGNYAATPQKKQFEAGLAALEKEDEPTLILLTDAVNLTSTDYYDLCQQALSQCAKLKDRFALFDVLKATDAIKDPVSDFRTNIGINNLSYGAAYYPYLLTMLSYAYQESKVKIVSGANTVTLDSIKTTDTTTYNQAKTALSQLRVVLPPTGAIAGVYASIDNSRGVWKAPANVSLNSVIGPTVKITSSDQDNLNIDPTAGKSINAIRAFTGKGTLVWGARTLAGNDNEWRYISVRRLFITVEESVQKASAFAVFEPNDSSTWLKVRAMIESFLYGLWQQGALAGSTPEAAYYVHVGLGKTMTAQDVLEGRLIVEIGLAAVRPAEFIVLRFSHKLQQA